MAQKKSEFLSAFGKAFQVWKALTDEVLDLGGLDEHIRSIETDKVLRRKLAELIVSVVGAARNTFRLMKFGDGRTTEELVRDGRYDYANSYVSSANFPVRSRKREVREIVLLEFDRDVSSEEAIVEATRQGLERPIHEDALYFGVEYSEVQRERPVVFLHEPWLGPNRNPSVLCLWGCASRRDLSLYCFAERWARRYRFAFVRK